MNESLHASGYKITSRKPISLGLTGIHMSHVEVSGGHSGSRIKTLLLKIFAIWLSAYPGFSPSGLMMLITPGLSK